jgi:lipopolysaccharide transport system permease protein
MYATPVIYSLQSLPEKYRSWIALNPLSHLIEIFRNGLLGTGCLDLSGLLYTTLFTSIILLAGMIIFNRNEKSFMDTV